MGLFFQGKRPKKGEIFRDPEPIAFFSFAHSNEGECEWRNQHRPSKDTWIRPVQSRTSSMILTNDYQRTINLVREGPMTTPTQTKGQRSSLGLPVTSAPFSDLKAGYGPSFLRRGTKITNRQSCQRRIRRQRKGTATMVQPKQRTQILTHSRRWIGSLSSIIISLRTPVYLVHE